MNMRYLLLVVDQTPASLSVFICSALGSISTAAGAKDSSSRYGSSASWIAH
jgi:hypothetical protein